MGCVLPDSIESGKFAFHWHKIGGIKAREAFSALQLVRNLPSKKLY